MALPRLDPKNLSKTLDFSSRQSGFTQVEFGFNEVGKPFIRCQCPKTDSNKKFIEKMAPKVIKWSHQVTLEASEDNYIWEVKGKRGICKIIALLSKQKYFAADSLIFRFKDQLVTNEFKTRSSPKACFEFHQFPENEKVKVISSHPVQKVEIKNGESYYFKPSRNKITEIEALSATYFQLLMGPDHVPDTESAYLLVDKRPIRIGVISKTIEKFTPAWRYRKDDQETLIKAGIVPALIFSYVLEEDDMNDGNWGFDKKGKISRIDFGRCFWPLTCKYVNFPPTRQTGNWFLGICLSPIKAFSITTYDLLNFPDIKDATPHRWWVNEEIKNNPAFCKEKWKYFLKAILLHDQTVLTEIAATYLGSEKAKNLYPQHFNDRLKDLKEKLIALPAFQDYLAAHPEDISELCAEFEIYNNTVKDQALKADIEAIKKSYNRMIDTVSNTEAYKDQLSYQEAKRALAETNMLRQGTPVGDQVNTILESLDQLNYEKINNLAHVKTYTQVAIQTKLMIEIKDPKTENAKKTMENYHSLAIQVSDKPSPAWKVLGVVMMGLGSLMIVGGVLLATATAVPTLGLGALGGGITAIGSAMFVTGMAFFANGNGSSSVSKKMQTLEQTIKKQM